MLKKGDIGKIHWTKGTDHILTKVFGGRGAGLFVFYTLCVETFSTTRSVPFFLFFSFLKNCCSGVTASQRGGGFFLYRFFVLCHHATVKTKT